MSCWTAGRAGPPALVSLLGKIQINIKSQNITEFHSNIVFYFDLYLFRCDFDLNQKFIDHSQLCPKGSFWHGNPTYPGWSDLRKNRPF